MEFTPEQKVLNDVFAKDMIYIIPEYQRPYSWDCIGKSDKNNQVNVMWQDLIEFHQSDNPNIYFLGSMVVIGDTTAREYEVVDGQQRLTTLTLLFISIKCFVEKIKAEGKLAAARKEEIESFVGEVIADIEDLVFNKKKFGAVTQTKKVKIARKIGFDYDLVLAEAINCGSIHNVNLTDATEEQQQVSRRFFDNQKFFSNKIAECFLEEDGTFSYGGAEKLNNFIEFLKNKVTIIQIRAQRFDIAYQIFEILNNRGLPLSNKDLFRNFLISEFSTLTEENLDPAQKWHFLEENYELDAEFISRYVESKRGKSQQYSAFNDLQDIYKGGFEPTMTKKKVQVFYDDLLLNLEHYTVIRRNDHKSKVIRNRVAFLLHCGNTRYILNFLLALFRTKSDEADLNKILARLELYIINILLGASKRFSSKPIYEGVNLLNAGGSTQDIIDLFSIEEDDEAKHLEALLNSSIKDNGVAKLMISKYLWSFDSLNTDDVITNELDYEKATLEHIIPQNPEKGTNWETDFSSNFRQEYTYRLGNMTLLTQKVNSAARNFDYTKKQALYADTKLHITNSISALDSISEGDIAKRHEMIVKKIIEDLGV